MKEPKLDTPLKNHKLNSKQLFVQKDSPIKAQPVRPILKIDSIKDDVLSVNNVKEDDKLLKPAIDIKIQPATPIHKPSRLQMNETAEFTTHDNVNVTVDSDDKDGSFERIGSVAERRRLFERPIAKGHERASARTFHPHITKGPDRASTRSMDYQMKGRSPLSLPMQDLPNNLREQGINSSNSLWKQETSVNHQIQGNTVNKPNNGGMNDSTAKVQNGVPFESVSFSKRMALFEKANRYDQGKTSPSPSTIQNEIKTVAQPKPISEIQPASVTAANETTKSPIAKENIYEAGWKLHPDKLKIPEIFK